MTLKSKQMAFLSVIIDFDDVQCCICLMVCISCMEMVGCLSEPKLLMLIGVFGPCLMYEPVGMVGS